MKYLSSLNTSKEKAEIHLGNVVYNSIKTVLSPPPTRLNSLLGQARMGAKAVYHQDKYRANSHGLYCHLQHPHLRSMKPKLIHGSNKESKCTSIRSPSGSFKHRGPVHRSGWRFTVPADQECETDRTVEGDHRQGPGRGGENQG